MNTRAGGVIGEQAACEYILKKRAMHILRRNYSCPVGEIDIIALDKGCVVFIEVKSRESESFGRGAEAVTRAKRRKIVRAAQMYLMSHHMEECDVRFDVIDILRGEAEYLENAFDMNDL